MSLGYKFFGKVASGINDTVNATTEIGDAGIDITKAVYHGITKKMPYSKDNDIFENVIRRKLTKKSAMVILPSTLAVGVGLGIHNVRSEESIGDISANASVMNQVYSRGNRGRQLAQDPRFMDKTKEISGMEGNEAELVFALHNMR